MQSHSPITRPEVKPEPKPFSLFDWINQIRKMILENDELKIKAMQLGAAIDTVQSQLAEQQKSQAIEKKSQANEMIDEDFHTKIENPFAPGLRYRGKSAKQTSTVQTATLFSGSQRKAQAKVSSFEDIGFLKHTTNTFLQALSGLSGLALGALTLPEIVKALQETSVHTGAPAGGVDYCAAIAFCAQGFLSNSTSGEILSQFSSIIGLTNSKGSFITEIALNDCFNNDKLAGVMSEVISKIVDWVGEADCSVTSNIWLDAQLTGKATNLNADACRQFASSYLSAANSCQTANTGAKIFGIGLGFSLGTIATALLCACTCFVAYLAYQSCKEHSYSFRPGHP